MLETIIITALFMIFQVFYLTKWIQKHEDTKNHLAWTPFRQIFLNSIVHYSDNLLELSTNYMSGVDLLLNEIKNNGELNAKSRDNLINFVVKNLNSLQKIHTDFQFTLQTVSPSIQPYAADYCVELFWFHSGVKNSLNKTLEYLKDIPEDKLEDNSMTSHPLNGVMAQKFAIGLFTDYRFINFKQGFVQSVWKKETLHYHERHNEFLTPVDYARALDSEKSEKELDAIPRTEPIKSFFS